MRSLRSRLILSYVLLVGAIITAVVVLLSRLAFGFLVEPSARAVSAAAVEARAIVAAHAAESPAQLAARIRAGVRHRGVLLFDRARRPQGARPFPERHGPPPGSAGFMMSLFSTMNMRPTLVPIPEAGIEIVPDLDQVYRDGIGFLQTVALAIAALAIGTFFAARWMTGQAIAPLIAVTGELKRFAGGDFTPRPLARSGWSELGELTEAYNGAAAQVAGAFDERRRIEEQMRHFLADAGHELRTPLCVIIAYIDVLRKTANDDRVLRERAFAALGLQTRRMSSLVERLMTLARLEHAETTAAVAVDLVALTREAIAALAPEARAAMHLEAPPRADILADPADVYEAIANLLENAAKYGAGTPVYIRITAAREGVTLRVSDGGPGIAPEDRTRLFERFYRGAQRGSTEGSGLGLAIALRGAERSGGSLVLEDGAAGATTFALRFPRTALAV